MKGHSPNIGGAGSIAPLRNKVDITAVPTPNRAQIVCGMIGQLRKIASVHPADENIRIEIDEITPVDPAPAHEQQPLAIGRYRRCGKTTLRIRYDTLLDACLIVNSPYFFNASLFKQNLAILFVLLISCPPINLAL